MGKNSLNYKIADAILERPIGLEVGGQQFYIYPVTLGQHLMIMNMLDDMGVEIADLTTNAIDTAMYLAKTNRESCLKIIAISLMKGKEVISKKDAVDKLAKKIEPYVDIAEVATLLIAVLTYSQDRINTFIKESNLQRDKNDLQRINAAKHNKNSFTFGGRTVYGQLIDSACERYGWTFEYVVWGISYINLNMILSDQVTSVFLSDQELKHVHISNDREVINADDPANKKRIMELFKE